MRIAEWSEEKKHNIRQRYREGWACEVLAKKMNVSKNSLWKFLRDEPTALTRIEKARFGVKKRLAIPEKLSGISRDDRKCGTEL